MKTILVTNQKGGVGKSTISDELAYALERDSIPFNFYCLDKQGDSIHDGIENEDAIVQIIDTPGRLKKDTKEYIEHADFIIIPTTMGRRDGSTLETMIEILKQSNRLKDVLVVFNRWTPFQNSKDFIEWFENNWPEIDTCILNQTSLIDNADARGVSIVKYRSSNIAAKQIMEIYSIVKHKLGLKEGWR